MDLLLSQVFVAIYDLHHCFTMKSEQFCFNFKLLNDSEHFLLDDLITDMGSQSEHLLKPALIALTDSLTQDSLVEDEHRI